MLIGKGASSPLLIHDSSEIKSNRPNKMDTFGAGTKCASKSDVRLIGSQIKGMLRRAGTNSKCRFTEVLALKSLRVKSQSTVFF